MDYDIIIGRDEKEKRDFGKRGLVFLGKQYVKMGENVSLSNKVYLDVAKTHVILVSGKRGCLTGDTIIFTDKGFKQIKDFDERNDKVYSFNKDKKEFEIENAKLLVYDIQDESLLNIEFSNGKNIVVTQEHPLLLYENKNLIWKIAYEIKKGDIVAGVKKPINNFSGSCALLLKNLNSLELEYCKVKDIDEVDNIEKVYDLSVSKNHSFIANGIISHNSGKSYTLSVIAEGVADLEEDVRKNLSILIFDTMGIFWTMKYPNERQRDLLEKWGEKPKAIDVKVFTPEGKFEYYKDKNITTDFSFTIRTSLLSAFDWCSVFDIKISEPLGVLIESVVSELEGKNYSIEDIIEEVKKSKKFENNIKLAAENRFINAKSWGLFSENGSKIDDLLKGNQTSILDISCYNESNVKALVVGLLSKLILEERIDARKLEEQKSIEEGKHYFEIEDEKREMPLVWLIIDECVTGDSIVITDKNHTPIKEVVKKVKNGESLSILSYNPETNDYIHKKVTNACEIPNREVIKLITESGRELKCTPDHLLLTKTGYLSAISAKELVIPLIQHYSEDKDAIKARLFGYLLGDGWLSKNKSGGFSGKKYPDDLNKIKKDLNKLGFSSGNIFSRITSSKVKSSNGKISNVKGYTNSINFSVKCFEFFYNLGAPVGEKVLQKVEVPNWILNGSEKIKSEFLAGLMGSDGYTISEAKNVKGNFNPIRLSFNKDIKLKEEALVFTEQIKSLFNDLGISIDKISERKGNVRKDGIETFKIQITISNNVKNTIDFLQKIGYKYCYNKEIQGLLWLEYLKAREYKKIQREDIRKQVLKLKEQGLGRIKISRFLKIKEYEARDYLLNCYKSGVPKDFDSFSDWTKKRLGEKMLFEKVVDLEKCGTEIVYDISVADTHNFITNGIISHNCHNFLHKEKETPATNSLIRLLREGRQPGISLVLATQQPGEIHKDVMTQADIVISHRLTAKFDIEALSSIMQTYLTSSLLSYFNNLPSEKGSALVLDDNSERIFPLAVKPKLSWHGGDTPSAVHKSKKLNIEI